MSSPLDHLVDKSLTAEPPDAKEFAGLKSSGRARLTDASNTSLSLEGRFDLAYNAAHAFSLAALRYRGYRPRNRYIVFQALEHTLGLGPRVWRVLARAHEQRNRSEYDGELNVDERFVEDLIAVCRTVAAELERLPPVPEKG